MTPQQFIAKWRAANLSERSACHQHFLDLCDVLDQPKPAAADPEGTHYTFERGVTKTDGTSGWVDVWMRGHFGLRPGPFAAELVQRGQSIVPTTRWRSPLQ